MLLYLFIRYDQQGALDSYLQPPQLQLASFIFYCII